MPCGNSLGDAVAEGILWGDVLNRENSLDCGTTYSAQTLNIAIFLLFSFVVLKALPELGRNALIFPFRSPILYRYSPLHSRSEKGQI